MWIENDKIIHSGFPTPADYQRLRREHQRAIVSAYVVAGVVVLVPVVLSLVTRYCF